MPELLLELGTEELPATFVHKAYTDLLESIGAALAEAGVLDGAGSAMGTPRRLIVSFANVKDRQEDSSKEQRGPALKAAYAADGTPTPALVGFCRSQGVAVEDLRRDEQYVWVTKAIPGRPTAEILAEVLPKAIRGLNFDKSMRWGSSRMRFARPIRWILASLGGEAVSFDIEGVASGLESRGHRFYSPEPFSATTLSDLLAGLRSRNVEPDPLVRREKIKAGAIAVASGTPEMNSALVDENTYLTEWPTAIEGTFGEGFMNLPEPVLVTAMAKHEKMFPVRDAEGRLTNKFVFVRNSGEDDTVRSGCEWVLNARFNDAKFFFEEDAKRSFDEFLAKTETIVFQEKLGSVRQRANRLAALARTIAEATGADDREAELADQAAQYAKADLATGLVSELSSLQGVIGGEYAKREGLAPEVAYAISAQYDPGKIGVPDDAAKRTGVRLVVADQLDKLAGYLGIGLAPSGSSDPYALRRAATVLIEAAWNWPGAFPDYAPLLTAALDGYEDQDVILDPAAAVASFATLFASRYESLMPDVRHDILDAALNGAAGAVTQPRSVRFRIAVLQAVAGDSAFVQTTTRPINIVAAARKKQVDFAEQDPMSFLVRADLDSDEGVALADAVEGVQEPLSAAVIDQRVDDSIATLRTLVSPINAFFNGTMVMVDDVPTRTARLTLLNAAAQTLLQFGDFSRLEQG